MSEQLLQIDTQGTSTAAKQEHNSAEVNQHSPATTTIHSESFSEESDESDSPIFDDSDDEVNDLSPTTPIHPEHHDHVSEKLKENPSLPEPIESETSAEESSDEAPPFENSSAEAQHVNEEPTQETSVGTGGEAEHFGTESAMDLSASALSKRDEEQHEPLSTPVETEDHVEGIPPPYTTSAIAEPGSSGDEIAEKLQATPEPSIAGAHGASEEIVPDPSLADETDLEPSVKEELQESPQVGENKLEESADNRLPETSPSASIEPEIGSEMAGQESQAPPTPKDLTTVQTPEVSKETANSTPSDPEKRALDTVKRARYQFGVTIDVFLQLINENEDDEGTIRLNLVERNSDFRKVVGMLGLKLQGLVDAERELDWAQLVSKHNAKKEQE